MADSQAIPNGTELTAAQAGHAFGNACKTGQPTLLKKTVPLWVTAFDFVPATGADYDAAFASPSGAIEVTVDFGVLDASCTMHVAGGLGGDGADLYDSLEAHIAEWWRDSEPTVDAIDGGLSWLWNRSDVDHKVTYVKTDKGFTVTHLAEAG